MTFFLSIVVPVYKEGARKPAVKMPMSGHESKSQAHRAAFQLSVCRKRSLQVVCISGSLFKPVTACAQKK